MVNIGLSRDSGIVDANFSYPDYEAYRDSIRALNGVVAYRPLRVTLTSAGTRIDQRTSAAESAMGRLGLLPPGASNAEFARTYVVSENYFDVLGFGLLRGRMFTNSTDEPSVLVSENYWRNRFSSDPAILGRTIRLNNVAVTIVGIAPRDFTGTNIAAPAFWIPASLEPLLNGDTQWLRQRENRRYRLFGRLAPGAAIKQAQAEINLVAERVRTLHAPDSESFRPADASVWPGSPFPQPLSQIPGVKLAVFLIVFATGMVLAVASANVGSLQLARGRSRDMEVRTRLSLGATRLRIARQLLTENALLGLLAGAVGFLFSWAILKVAVRAFAEAMPAEIGTVVFDVNPNLAVFAFVVLISLSAGILAGLAPAIQSSRSTLTAPGRASTPSIRGRRLQDALVAVQVGLSLVLVITATMFARGAAHSLGLSPGYDSSHVVELNLQFPKTYTAARKSALVNELRSRILSVPGVTGVTNARAPGPGFSTAVMPLESARQSAQSIMQYTYVQRGYFDTLGIPLYLGKDFDSSAANAGFVVLSESASKQVFGAENPIGRSIRLGVIDEVPHDRKSLVAEGPAYQVIGVSRDTRGWAFDGSDSKQVYLSLPNDRIDTRPILIRTGPNATSLLTQVEKVSASLDPEIVTTAFTLEDALRQSPPFIGSMIAASVASSLGVLGLLLALVGVVGTVAHTVAMRTREVGIRMAVGAQKHDVLGLILQESSRPVVVGSGVGMALALGVAYLMRSLLYGVNAVDGIYFLGASAAFFLVALLAAYPPARRALRIDPVAALRHE